MKLKKTVRSEEGCSGENDGAAEASTIVGVCRGGNEENGHGRGVDTFGGQYGAKEASAESGVGGSGNKEDKTDRGRGAFQGQDGVDNVNADSGLVEVETKMKMMTMLEFIVTKTMDGDLVDKMEMDIGLVLAKGITTTMVEIFSSWLKLI